MFSFRTFQTRLFMTYTVFLIVFTLILSIPLYLYIKNTTEKNIVFGVQQSLTVITESLDMFFTQYENITNQLYLMKSDEISRNSAVSWLHLLAGSPDETEALKAHNSINESIALLAEIYKGVHRINIFSDEGVFFSNRPHDILPTAVLRNEREWLDLTAKGKGVAMLSYFDHDPWVTGDASPVYVLTRQLNRQGHKIGYLEVQIRADELLAPEKLTRWSDASLWIMNSERLLYTNSPLSSEHLAGESALFRTIASESGSLFGKQRITYEGVKESLLYRHSTKTGYTVFYTIPENTLYAPVYLFRNVALLAFLTLMLLSVLVFYLLSKSLTYPIVKLKRMIDTVDLEDKALTLRDESGLDEIALLNRSFQKMNVRLQSSLEEIVSFRTMQLQSRFEVLQSQINPHFLFNMLGVIAILSEEERTKVADTCRKLADFLRYTIVQTNPITTLELETAFAQNYLELMETRYAHRLQFELSIPDAMKRISLPKLTIQPLVENAITHGFQNIEYGLKVTIQGRMEAGRWHLVIADNGCGIEQERLASIHRQLELYSADWENLYKQEQLSLGGMGIISTFMRLKLYFKNRVDFNIGSGPEGGVRVDISGFVQDMNDNADTEGIP
ncbi:cache domain-containing sensor histidine kinase [Cohnella silvisoli]|uniref:Histidine kinase n=1 Tax=Cohnella silvisoli TaxID=2873699 RepID=A0ABV1KUC9_9BACL|nr:sensor histidine kinase [Cohnella silvisoli]MCD9023149.1 histidine kinase [Cohnella silvisoli]